MKADRLEVNKDVRDAIIAVLGELSGKFASTTFMSGQSFIYQEAEREEALKPAIIKTLVDIRDYAEAYKKTVEWRFEQAPKVAEFQQQLDELKHAAQSYEHINDLRRQACKSLVRKQVFDMWVRQNELQEPFEASAESAAIRAIGFHPTNVHWIWSVEGVYDALAYITLQQWSYVCVGLTAQLRKECSKDVLSLGAMNRGEPTFYIIDLARLDGDDGYLYVLIQLQYLLTDSSITKIYRTPQEMTDVKYFMYTSLKAKNYPVRTGYESGISAVTLINLYVRYLNERNPEQPIPVSREVSIETIENDLLHSSAHGFDLPAGNDIRFTAALNIARNVAIYDKLDGTTKDFVSLERERDHFLSTTGLNLEIATVKKELLQWSTPDAFDFWIGLTRDKHPTEFICGEEVIEHSIRPIHLSDVIKMISDVKPKKIDFKPLFPIPTLNAYDMECAPKQNQLSDAELWYASLCLRQKDRPFLKQSPEVKAIVNVLLERNFLQDAVDFLVLYVPQMLGKFPKLREMKIMQEVWRRYFLWGTPIPALVAQAQRSDAPDMWPVFQRAITEIQERDIKPMFDPTDIVDISHLQIQKIDIVNVRNVRDLGDVVRHLSFVATSSYVPVGYSLSYDLFTDTPTALYGTYVANNESPRAFIIDLPALQSAGEINEADRGIVQDYLDCLITRLPHWTDEDCIESWKMLTSSESLAGCTIHTKFTTELFKFQESFSHTPLPPFRRFHDLTVIAYRVGKTQIANMTQESIWHIVRSFMAVKLGEQLVKNCCTLLHWSSMLKPQGDLDSTEALTAIDVLDSDPIYDPKVAVKAVDQFLYGNSTRECRLVSISWQSQLGHLSLPVVAMGYRLHRVKVTTFCGNAAVTFFGRLNEVCQKHLVIAGRDSRLLFNRPPQIWSLRDVYKLWGCRNPSATSNDYDVVLANDYAGLIYHLTRQTIDQGVRFHDWTQKTMTRRQKEAVIKETACVLIAAETLKTELKIQNESTEVMKRTLESHLPNSQYDTMDEQPSSLDEWMNYFDDDTHHVFLAAHRARISGFPSHLTCELIRNMYISAYQ